MILLDLNQLVIANIMMGTKHGTEADGLNETLIRHMVMTSLKTVNKKFRAEYGKMIVCCDSRDNWRRETFPYYKANRKKSRDSSPLDWKLIFDTMDKIRSEIKTYLPFVVIDVVGAEADDVIGTLCHRKRPTLEKVLIISGDEDFVQLQVYPGVVQWDQVRKRWVTGKPVEHLKTKFIRGDVGDGVPNFLSDDDTLVTPNKRSKSIYAAKEAEWLKDDALTFLDTEEKRRNWNRNVTMMDLSKTPAHIQDEIMDKYIGSPDDPIKDKTTIMEYFQAFGLRKLMEDLHDFG